MISINDKARIRKLMNARQYDTALPNKAKLLANIPEFKVKIGDEEYKVDDAILIKWNIGGDDIIQVRSDKVFNMDLNAGKCLALISDYADESELIDKLKKGEVKELVWDSWEKYIDGERGRISNSHICNERLKVSPEDMKKAKESGVVQKKPNGMWGIIAMKKGEWWDANYQSEDSARNALKAYHASRRRASRTYNPVDALSDKSMDLSKGVMIDDSLVIKKDGNRYIITDKDRADSEGGYVEVENYSAAFTDPDKLIKAILYRISGRLGAKQLN